MARESSDPMARIVHFEEEFTRVRGQLVGRFAAVVKTERAQRESARRIQTLALRAQWAVVVASVLGIVLVVVMAKQPRPAVLQPVPTSTESPTDPTEPTVLTS
jgi:hypothetical protein